MGGPVYDTAPAWVLILAAAIGWAALITWALTRGSRQPGDGK